MCLFTWMQSRTQKLYWYDWLSVKWSALIFGLFLAKVWPPILGLAWYWYLFVSILLALLPGYKYFFGK